MSATIYIIVNLMNDKAYVGVTADLEKRLGQHMFGRTDRPERPICRAIRKYRWNSFAVAVLDRHDNWSYAVKVLEPHYISKYQTNVRGIGYNLTNGGEGSFGFKHTDETRSRLSRMKRGGKMSAQGRANIAKASALRRHTPETKEKIRRAKLGVKRKPFSAEWRTNMSKSRIWLKPSEKSVALFVARAKGSFRGRQHSAETKAKLSAINTGKTMSPESRRKISMAASSRKRQPHSAATREKMRQSALRRWHCDQSAGSALIRPSTTV